MAEVKSDVREQAIQAAWEAVRALLYLEPDYTTIYEEVVAAVDAAIPILTLNAVA